MPARRSSAPKAADVAITVRLPRDLLKRIDRWIADQQDPVGRSEAIRRLAEAGLDRGAAPSKTGKLSRGAEQAAGMANDMIDSLGDRSATHEDREHRKRRLVKGPSEFREMRKKHDDARRKK
jgi:metal-responsive CopG/Arc/MetJ family transcriptional regulator